jgi:dipeptidyl aminopeptidase/acylaminoacyl peptidase
VKTWNLALLCALTALLCACQQGKAATSLRIQHPDDSTKQVEYFLERPAGNAPWPTVVLLHGHQESKRVGGKDFVDWGALQKLAGRGYLAVAISQPGYGQSTGPADFSGVVTQHTVTAVISKLRADGLASPKKLVIQGISRGALTAGLVAAQDSSVSGVVLISGVYDLPAYVAGSAESRVRKGIVESMMLESGGATESLVARSILHRASDIKADVLVLNGANDDRTDPNQALLLADKITRAGGNARAIIYRDVGHQIPVELRNKDIDTFTERVLAASSE